jgi:CDP-glycerol glycerophosphotransferase (TagB/SpsB family)
MLAQFDSGPIVVKHHTRTTNDELNRVFREQAGQNIDEVPTVQLVSDDVHSVSLLEWGDVFIDAGTSVIFEAVVRDKPILQLEYSHWNESTVARYLPGTAVKSRDDFYNHLRTINTASTTAELPTTYGSDERVTFINELIYPNGENVLESYAALLLDD